MNAFIGKLVDGQDKMVYDFVYGNVCWSGATEDHVLFSTVFQDGQKMIASHNGNITRIGFLQDKGVNPPEEGDFHVTAFTGEEWNPETMRLETEVFLAWRPSGCPKQSQAYIPYDISSRGIKRDHWKKEARPLTEPWIKKIGKAYVNVLPPTMCRGYIRMTAFGHKKVSDHRVVEARCFEIEESVNAPE